MAGFEVFAKQQTKYRDSALSKRLRHHFLPAAFEGLPQVSSPYRAAPLIERAAPCPLSHEPNPSLLVLYDRSFPPSEGKIRTRSRRSASLPPTESHLWGAVHRRNRGQTRSASRCLPDPFRHQHLTIARCLGSFAGFGEGHRGSSRERAAGLSWTTRLDVAKQFARGHRSIVMPKPVIATAQIDKRHILALIADRQESEVLIDFRQIVISKRRRHPGRASPSSIALLANSTVAAKTFVSGATRWSAAAPTIVAGTWRCTSRVAAAIARAAAGQDEHRTTHQIIPPACSSERPAFDDLMCWMMLGSKPARSLSDMLDPRGSLCHLLP